MHEVRIWTDDEELIVDTEDIDELEHAMRFKAEYIKAKAEPELFVAVADALRDLFEVGMEDYRCNNRECAVNISGRCNWQTNYRACDDRY